MITRARAERAAKQCVVNARYKLGAGWGHVSKDVQWGLVAANILARQDGQDEETPAEVVVETTKVITTAAWNMVNDEGAG